MIVQVYEIQTPAEAERVIERGVNHVGSVVPDAQRWKNEAVSDTMRTVAQSDARSSLIPLFPDADRISFALDFYRPDIVHFCDTVIDDPARWEAVCGACISVQATVRERFPEMAIMRSVPVPPPGETLPVSLEMLARYFEPLTDYFLIDTYFTADSPLPANAAAGTAGGKQPVSGFIGITGKTCDWDTAAGLVKASGIPVLLAGGLSPCNVFDAIVAVRPAGVDSCTNTNAVDEYGTPVRFRKDMEKVARFVKEARRGGQWIQGDKHDV